MEQQNMICTSCGPSGFPVETFQSWPFIVLYVLLALSVLSFGRQAFCSATVKVGDRVLVRVTQPLKEVSGKIQKIQKDCRSQR